MTIPTSSVSTSLDQRLDLTTTEVWRREQSLMGARGWLSYLPILESAVGAIQEYGFRKRYRSASNRRLPRRRSVQACIIGQDHQARTVLRGNGIV